MKIPLVRMMIFLRSLLYNLITNCISKVIDKRLYMGLPNVVRHLEGEFIKWSIL